jgi:hypothetical protein
MNGMDRPAHPEAAPAPALSPALVLLLLIGIVAAKHLTVGLSADGFFATGRLTDTDSWVRVQRVLELWQGAGWFEERTARLNAPTGLSLHWTRPLDVLILLPAQVLAGLFGVAPRDAVLLAGACICPALHAACAVAAAWAASAVWTGLGPLLAGLLVAGSPPVGGYSGFGRADHHTLIVLFALLALGAAVRAAARPGNARGAAWSAGAFAGAGVWVSPEALLAAAPVLAAFGVLWVAEGMRGFSAGGGGGGGAAAAQGLRASLGFTLVVAPGVVCEHPPSAWLDAPYDKVSTQHVLMGALAASVFAVAGRLSGNAARRAVTGGAAAVTAACVLLLFRPRALQASLAGVDAEAAEHFMRAAEMEPIPLSLSGLLNDAPMALGAVPAALLALVLAIPSWRREGKLAVAVPLGLALVAALPAAFLHRRFSLDLAAPACLLAAGLPVLALGLRDPLRRAAAAFLAAALVFGVPFLSRLGATEADREAAAAADSVAYEECGTAALSGPFRPTSAMAGGAAAPVLFVNSINLGPELAWRTPYRVVAAPYHRGGAAIMDTVAFFGATDDNAARAIAARREAALVLVCAPSPREGAEGASLLARLRRGEAPEWLTPVPLPDAPAGVRLFAVQPMAAEVAAGPAGGG